MNIKSKNVDRRFYFRYRSYLIIGLLILICQLYLVLKFFSVDKDISHNWEPHVISDVDFDTSVNSARRIRDGIFLDDEDTSFDSRVKPHESASNNPAGKPRSNRSALRLEELDFEPPCEVRGKDAISAIHRAKTQQCKQELVNVTCLAQAGLLYPKALPNYCPKNGFVAGRSLGCFKDEKTFRLLDDYFVKFKTKNSPLYCIRVCLQSGFAYAGVQYSTECFCGNDEPAPEVRLPDSSCNMKCPADPHLACGGYLTTNIYETGIAPFTVQIAQTFGNATNLKPVRIVFLLTLNGRAVRQVRRFIKLLYHKKHYFFIHVDARQDYLFRELLELETRFPNIRLTRQRFSSMWGGASLLTMLLSAMQELLASNWNWDFVINLSESDFPVKTVRQLEEFLSVNIDKNFVKSHGREVQRFIQKQGLDKTFVECDTHMWRQGDRELPWGVQVDGGSDWIALSKEFVKYVAAKNPDDLVQGLKVVYKYTILPAESFFHTVLKNSRFCNTYVDNNLHVTNWKRKLGCRCQYKHIVDWCGCSPNDFKPDDWLKIQGTESKQLFFARKFEAIINQAVIQQTQEWLHGSALSDTKHLNSYWQSVFHYADLSPVPDDAYVSVAHSIMRIISKLLGKNGCELMPRKLVEISSYHHLDSYVGTLVLFDTEVQPSGDTVRYETLFQPRDTMVLYRSSLLAQRLQSIVVSSEYDQKEQTFRNFARILGPFSEPFLLYQFLPSLAATLPANVTFLWIDPAGQLADVSNTTIDETYTHTSLKLGVKSPLLPGAWTVKLIHDSQFIAQTSFLISPLEFMTHSALSSTQVQFIHSGTFYKEFDSKWTKFLDLESEQNKLLTKSLANAKRFGFDLREWIDSLVEKFYKIKRTCAVNRTEMCGLFKLEKCSETSWSSQAPDPKSTIGQVNETTGYLNTVW